jgi:hypothetical protein
MFLASESSSNILLGVTFELWRVVVGFVFQLHIFDQDLGEVCARDLPVALLIHVLCQWGVAFRYGKGLPAPMLRSLLSFLIN